MSEYRCATAGIWDVCFLVGCQSHNCCLLLSHPRAPRSTYTSAFASETSRLCCLSSAACIWLTAPFPALALCSHGTREQLRCYPPNPFALTFSSSTDTLLSLRLYRMMLYLGKSLLWEGGSSSRSSLHGYRGLNISSPLCSQPGTKPFADAASQGRWP